MYGTWCCPAERASSVTVTGTEGDWGHGLTVTAQGEVTVTVTVTDSQSDGDTGSLIASAVGSRIMMPHDILTRQCHSHVLSSQWSHVFQNDNLDWYLCWHDAAVKYWSTVPVPDHRKAQEYRSVMYIWLKSHHCNLKAWSFSRESFHWLSTTIIRKSSPQHYFHYHLLIVER